MMMRDAISFWEPVPGSSVTKIHIGNVLNPQAMACNQVATHQCRPWSGAGMPPLGDICGNCKRIRPEVTLDAYVV